MSILSNTSQSHSTVYQYQILKSPNQILNMNHNLSFTLTNNVTGIIYVYAHIYLYIIIIIYIYIAYESYWTRRILSNILLSLFRYHPNGVLECELCQRYSQIFSEQLVLTMDSKYLLCVHKSIFITNIKERGQLYTLFDIQISLFLQEFDSLILPQLIIKHIRRLFRCFPNGIAVNCLQDLLYNMVEFKLENIIIGVNNILIHNLMHLHQY